MKYDIGLNLCRDNQFEHFALAANIFVARQLFPKKSYVSIDGVCVNVCIQLNTLVIDTVQRDTTVKYFTFVQF